MKTLIRFATGLLFLIGILFLVWLTRQNTRLTDDIARLQAELGRMSIDDKDRVHIVAIKEPRVPPEVASHTQRVWQFRIYFPAGYDVMQMHGSGRVAEDGFYLEGGFSSSWGSPKPESRQAIVTLSLYQEGDQTKGCRKESIFQWVGRQFCH